MKKKRDWIENEWVWGYLPETNTRVRGRVANANGLSDGYVRIWTDEGGGEIQTVYVVSNEDPRR